MPAARTLFPKIVMRLNMKDVHVGILFFQRNGPRRVVRAVNRSAKSAKVALTRAVAKDMGLRQKDVKDRITFEKAEVGDPIARLLARRDRVPLIKFKAKGREPSFGKGRGVSYRLPTGRGRIPSGFIATMPSGHRGVYLRTRKGGRTPITELHGPSVGLVFEKKIPEGRARYKVQLLKNLRSEIRFAFRRRAR